MPHLKNQKVFLELNFFAEKKMPFLKCKDAVKAISNVISESIFSKILVRLVKRH